jgi:hypothetical protein
LSKSFIYFSFSEGKEFRNCSTRINRLTLTRRGPPLHVQGDRMSFLINGPKCGPTHFCVKNEYITFSMAKSCVQMWATSEIIIKLPKENNRPMRKNLPNLVTLFSLYIFNQKSLLKTSFSLSCKFRGNL